VIHGDLHPGNLLYDGDSVSAFLDFDYAAPGMAIRDIGDCLLFVAGSRQSDFDPDDIWSLAQPCRIEKANALAFLQGYISVRPIPRDWLDLPVVLSSRWIQIRVRGSRKVSREEKVRFLLRDLESTLDYLSGELPAILADIVASLSTS